MVIMVMILKMIMMMMLGSSAMAISLDKNISIEEAEGIVLAEGGDLGGTYILID
jgi:hypothetical protein